MPHTSRTLHESVNFPAHDPRTETPAYKAAHHQLVVVEDRPCRICGVRNSTLHDPAHNRCGATALETHHAEIEWALSNAIDLDKFNVRVLPYLHRKTGEARYLTTFTHAELLAWIDHDHDNLQVLCSTHHRGLLVGIHSVTGPVWRCQDILLEDYDLTGFHASSPAEAAQLTALPVTTGVASAPLPTKELPTS